MENREKEKKELKDRYLKKYQELKKQISKRYVQQETICEIARLQIENEYNTELRQVEEKYSNKQHDLLLKIFYRYINCNRKQISYDVIKVFLRNCALKKTKTEMIEQFFIIMNPSKKTR